MSRERWKGLRGFIARQGGFTLAETLLALSIMVVIGSTLVGSLYQMSSVTARGAAYLAIEADLRTSMQWLAKDLRMAQVTDLVDAAPAISCAALAPAACATLDWTDQYNEIGASHSASYALVGTEFRRTYDGTTHTIARNVADVEVSRQGALVTVTLTSSSDAWEGASRQFTHYFYLRAS